ncbi:MAG: hypothetical protein KJ060_05500 [Candidatus Hydrogenedentes bacterium]|nr:hypothetical protein [Candidatus Hydrogenedentota bacterium]
MKNRKTLRIVLIVLALLLFFQTATYYLWAPEARGRLLVLKSLGGFEGGPPVNSYIVIDNGSLRQLSPREYRGMEELLQERGTTMVVYRDQLPPENLQHFEEGVHEYIQYVDASQNSWAIKYRGPFFFHASFGNYTGPLGAYGSSGLFVWVFGKWFQVWYGTTYMA